MLSASDPVTPCNPSSFPAQDKARVPFKPGTVLTTAWGIEYGDVESGNTIDSIDDSTVATTNATPAYKNDNGKMAKALTLTTKLQHRLSICRQLHDCDFTTHCRS